MLKICFKVEKIDYGKCFESLIPRLLEECRSKKNPTELEKLLVRLGSDTVPIVKKLLGFLDTDVRDQIIVWLLEDQNDVIVSSVNAALKEFLGGEAVVIGAVYAKDEPGTKISLHAVKVKTDSKKLIESPALTGIAGGAAKLVFRIADAKTIEKEGIRLLSSDFIKPKLIAILSDSLREAGLYLTVSDLAIEEDFGTEMVPRMIDPEKDEGLFPDAIEDKIIDALVAWLKETV
jgi:hypothetical protein